MVTLLQIVQYRSGLVYELAMNQEPNWGNSITKMVGLSEQNKEILVYLLALQLAHS